MTMAGDKEESDSDDQHQFGQNISSYDLQSRKYLSSHSGSHANNVNKRKTFIW